MTRAIRAVGGLLCLFVVLLGIAGCEYQDNRRTMPGWFTQLERMEGVNLPHLEPSERFLRFVNDPSFQSNVSRMGWNVFRLPIEWDDYVDQAGALDQSKIQAARSHLQALVRSLRQARASASGRTLLILDFHQYKFGRVCGGVGVPRGKIKEEGLRPSDPNCVFLAFERFWRNENGVLDGWVEWAHAFLRDVPVVLQDETEWLTFGIEPINEPQFGTSRPVFVDSIVQTLWNFKEFMETAQNQIDRNLIPFYERFLRGLNGIAGLKRMMKNSLFIFDPFLMDHLAFDVGIGPVRIGFRSDGRYNTMMHFWRIPGSDEPVFWLAAPHHYVGALDQGFLSFLPASLAGLIERYPNRFVNYERISQRFQWQQARMAEAGMQMIIGEWGTQTGLLDENGRPGGYRQWIADSKRAIAAHSLGGVWWQYVQDGSASQDSFYLLKRIDEQGRTIPWHEQVLKCDDTHDLARVVFGHCGE